MKSLCSYVAVGSVVLGLCAGIYARGITAQLASERADNASLTAQIETQKQIVDQMNAARVRAEAEAERQRVKAEEYDAVRAALSEGGFDAELPDDFRAILAGILRN